MNLGRAGIETSAQIFIAFGIDDSGKKVTIQGEKVTIQGEKVTIQTGVPSLFQPSHIMTQYGTFSALLYDEEYHVCVLDVLFSTD
ncbi:hypothetical protein AVEN_172602-1 [Araneus ventricosus]|uniref:Uncharacterized protein n=1 Tax=Araneus ventricosus TaxID=182803 RepID=A0A4Y2MDT2_ARAVE|nr:hypothetical protein AVEN_172602-1 [Araneus ventricosus]